MFKRILLFAIGSILCLQFCSFLNAETEIISNPFLAAVNQGTIPVSLEMAGAGVAGPLDECAMTNPCVDLSFLVNCALPGPLQPPMTLFAFQDPSKTCPPTLCTGVYPFEVDSLHAMLTNCAATTCFAAVTPIIYEATYPTDPDCPVPGNILCMGTTFNIVVQPQVCVDYSFPLPESCCVDGPYFAALRIVFTDCTNLSACIDTNCTPCCNYVDFGGGPLEACANGLIGDLAIWTEGFHCCQSVCGPCPPPPPPCDTGNNHYKVWIFPPQPIDTMVQVRDQFMTDMVHLASRSFLANPVTKIVGTDTTRIQDPDDHLTWYLAHGQPTLLGVTYKNQFESTTVAIDSVRWLLVPTTKQPHDTFDCLDHYKCYYIRNPRWLQAKAVLQDQFDVPNFEQIDSLLPVYFCTPCSKDGSPQFDTLTHYVAYWFAEPTPSAQSRITEDQFGIHSLSNFSSWGLLVPTEKISFGPPECSDGADNDGDGLVDFPADCGCTDPTDPTEAPNPLTQCNDGLDNDGDFLIDLADPDCANECDNEEGVPQADTGPNHFKTWRIQFIPTTSIPPQLVKDQFMKDTLRFVGLDYLSNPVQKIYQNDTFNITDPDEHLNWYRVSGRNFPRTLHFKNQFESTSVTIDSTKYLLVPAQKLTPFFHNPPESLDHYKAYRIRDQQILTGPVFLDDQFDFSQETITTLQRLYFLTPAEKIRVPAEPRFDTLTHYVAYLINPQSSFFSNASTVDQFAAFAPWNMFVLNSELLLVPTEKICNAQPGDVNGIPPISLPDIVYLANYIFDKDRDLIPGPPPECLGADPGTCWPITPLCRGEVNGIPPITLADAIYLVNYVFDKDRPLTGCLGLSPGNCWCPEPTETCCDPIMGCP